MEIVVATTIFAIVVSSLMALLNYTLRINRRAEALRQATQGMRNFVEFLVKEIRNGEIDYAVENGTTIMSQVGQCPRPSSIGANTYTDSEGRTNALGVINSKGERVCFYLADAAGVYAGLGRFSGLAANNNPIETLVVKKDLVAQEEILNPRNFKVKGLVFFVRPRVDPYSDLSDDGSGEFAKIQPMVAMTAEFEVELPTKEKVTMYYQTAVSVNQYDIPK